MSEYSSLKATINANIKTNGNQEITGSIMNSVLNAMVNSMGAGYQFMGVATPTNPGSAQTPDYKCLYLATTPGTYTNLGGLVVADGEVALLKWDSAWTKEVTGIATAAQILMPNEINLKDYIINGIINESTGVVIPDIPTRLTTSIYFKKVFEDYLIIDQTDSATKFSFGGYKHTQIGTAPEWIPYQKTNIIQIRLEDGCFYSLYIANGSNNISPSDLADVKFSYGFYDEVSAQLKEIKTENAIIVSTTTPNITDDSNGVFLDLGPEPGIMVGGKIYWLSELCASVEEYRQINLLQYTSGESSYRLLVFDMETNIIQSVPYSTITGLRKSELGKYIIICSFNRNGNRLPKNIQGIAYTINGVSPFETITKNYAFFGNTTPNVVSNENETYLDLGPDPGIMVDGNIYWFSSWFPEQPSIYRHINLRYIGSGESALRAIVVNLASKAITNIPYSAITSDKDAYRNSIILCTFDRMNGLPVNLQGINYTINGGGETPGDSIVELNPNIISKVANSARAFHYDPTIGTSPLNLIYFSDIHGDIERTRRMFELKGQITSYIDDVLFTGDSDNYPNDTTWWNDYAKQMLIALGNHEYMIKKVEGVWQHATPQQVYDKFIAPYKSYWTGVVFPDNPETGKSYYYKDYSTKKVRLIALDYMEINLNPDSTQIAWFTSILDDVLANHPDYHVVIAVHQCAFKSGQNFKNPFDSIDFNSDDSGVLPVGIPQAVDTFINNGGHFVCYFTGHDHVDHFGFGENYPNQLNISICCAAMFAEANTMDVQRVADTKSQDLFNIVSIDTYSSIIKMIRVGCDYDRQLRKKDTICFYYGKDEFDSQKTYRIGQIVVYQSKIYQFLRNYNGGGWNPAIVCEIDRLIYC